MWPHYSVYRADTDYADIAKAIGLTGSSKEELIEGLVQKIIDLAESVGIKMAYKATVLTRLNSTRKLTN